MDQLTPSDDVSRRPRGLGRRGVRLGRIAGVEVTLDWSLLIIFVLITMTLGGGLLPAWHPQWGAGAVFLTAASAAVLFLVSVLLHELSHALVGRHLGMRIRQITLFVFGGMAHLEDEPRTWRVELAMAAAGPVTSLVLGVLLIYLAGWMTGPLDVDPENPVMALSGLSPLATILLWLGPINILLGLFNLVPGFPLDGGRVLRALLWGATGDFVRATHWAAAAGQGVAWLLIASGFAMILGLRVPIFGTGPIGGLWVALIGWFLNNAALMSQRRMEMQQVLGDVPVNEVMYRDLISVAPDWSLQDLVDEHLLTSSQRGFPVEQEGSLRGLVCLSDVQRVERDKRGTTKVSQVMTPVEALHTLSVSDKASDALDRLGRYGVNQLPVVENGRVLGMVTREGILRWSSLSRRS
jgi:Zn-dependent protease/CBS domain-containing protein